MKIRDNDFEFGLILYEKPALSGDWFDVLVATTAANVSVVGSSWSFLSCRGFGSVKGHGATPKL